MLTQLLATSRESGATGFAARWDNGVSCPSASRPQRPRRYCCAAENSNMNGRGSKGVTSRNRPLDRCRPFGLDLTLRFGQLPAPPLHQLSHHLRHHPASRGELPLLRQRQRHVAAEVGQHQAGRPVARSRCSTRASVRRPRRCRAACPARRLVLRQCRGGCQVARPAAARTGASSAGARPRG